MENNFLSPEGLPKPVQHYGQAVTSWLQYAKDNALSPEQTQAGLNKLVQGNIPPGQDPIKGLLTAWGAGAAMVGSAVSAPAVGAAAVVAGGVIGGSANAGVQLSGDKPFDFIDWGAAITTGALTQGKGPLVSTVINVGGAAVGSVIKDENPTNSMIGVGAGSLIGVSAGAGITQGLKPTISDNSAAIIGSIGGSTLNEATNTLIQNHLTSPQPIETEGEK